MTRVRVKRRSLLAHVDANITELAPAHADSSEFTFQGRTSHLESNFSNGILIHQPGDIIPLPDNPAWRTSWSIRGPD